jgi:penicillin amidase
MPERLEFRLDDLDAPVEILIDTWGVPHIYAESRADLFVAQGFNAARARLFQMDLWRRRGLGLMAEAFEPASSSTAATCAPSGWPTAPTPRR